MMMEVLAALAVVLTPVAVGVGAGLAFPSLRPRIVARLPGEAALLWLAWGVAAVATAASLYLSEVVGFPPCRLCWIQRGAMYPLVVLLAGALATGRPRLARLTWPLPAAGLAVAAYHAVIQLRPSLDVVACQGDAPCTARWVAVFGFVSIPWLAGAAFVLILVLQGAAAASSAGNRAGYPQKA